MDRLNTNILKCQKKILTITLNRLEKRTIYYNERIEVESDEKVKSTYKKIRDEDKEMIVKIKEVLK